MTDPFFTVLLPAFNVRGHIGFALRDLLAQTCRDFEIVVVDDGSTDGTGDAVKSISDPRIRLITLPQNRGLVAALNAGLAEAHGQWIARQDADDRCRPDRLARQKALISQNPEAVLFYSRATLIDARGWWRGNLRPPLTDAGLRWDLCFRNPVPHTSAVFPVSLVRDQLQGYTGDNVTADFDLWSRLLRQGRAVGDGECLVSYRNHHGSIMGRENTAAKKLSNEGLREILCRNLQDWAGATEAEAGRIPSAWLEPAEAGWAGYFSVREKLASCPLQPDAGLIAEEDYTLMHRALASSPKCAATMLAVMRKDYPRRYAALPRLRTFLTRLMRGF
ncbi:MAG: glycosyltransferase family 2 protein [Terrimicrobiaceae bacterium]